MESGLARSGEEIYEENRNELEKSHLGRIIAIDVESRKIAGIGDTVEEAYSYAVKAYPDRHFYFRKVGEDRAAGYILPVV